MKKLFFALMLMATGICAQAQFFAGGTVGLDVLSAHEDKGASSTQTTFEIAPEFGYSFNSTWAVGAQIGYGLMSRSGETLNVVRIMPYVRATFARAGIVDFFGEAAVGYAHQSVDDQGVSGTVAALRPGIAINFSDKFALIARTGLFQYEYWDGLGIFEFALNKSFEAGVQFTF